MKRNFIALCALLLAACGSQEPKITLFSNEAFQTEADGKPVGIYTLRAGDVTMQVTNYGARVVSLWTPDRAGDYEDIPRMEAPPKQSCITRTSTTVSEVRIVRARV